MRSALTIARTGAHIAAVSVVVAAASALGRIAGTSAAAAVHCRVAAVSVAAVSVAASNVATASTVDERVDLAPKAQRRVLVDHAAEARLELLRVACTARAHGRRVREARRQHQYVSTARALNARTRLMLVQRVSAVAGLSGGVHLVESSCAVPHGHSTPAGRRPPVR